MSKQNTPITEERDFYTTAEMMKIFNCCRATLGIKVKQKLIPPPNPGKIGKENQYSRVLVDIYKRRNLPRITDETGEVIHDSVAKMNATIQQELALQAADRREKERERRLAERAQERKEARETRELMKTLRPQPTVLAASLVKTRPKPTT